MGNPTVDVPLAVGDIVKIRKYAVNPSSWDDDCIMLRMAIKARPHKVSVVRGYGSFLLEGSHYVWRRKDLIIISRNLDGPHDPNFAFIVSKKKR
jgi:hypothetical protein